MGRCAKSDYQNQGKQSYQEVRGVNVLTRESAMSTQCSYLYGVVPANGATSFGPIGIDGGDVWIVQGGPIAMVTGPVRHGDFSQLPPQKALQCLAEHQRVLERVMNDHTVVPVKFGTVVEDDRQISNILETARE